MNTITLNIKDTNLQTVMTILDNLKIGLIDSIDVDSKSINKRNRYKPVVSKIVMENESVQGKYISTSSYKKRLNTK